MIELRNITIETRHPILNNVDYTFSDERIYGIVAENGSGKTTIFRSLVDLKKPLTGTILFDNQSVEKVLGKVFYYESIEWLDKNLSGMDYLKFVKTTWKSDLTIADIVESWKMGEFINIPTKKYSLGMKQRLVIAMYLISNAKYLIMDEITNGLDEENRKVFFQQLLDLKNKGKTILISSHYKDEIVKYCDVVLEIKKNTLSEVPL